MSNTVSLTPFLLRILSEKTICERISDCVPILMFFIYQRNSLYIRETDHDITEIVSKDVTVEHGGAEL